MSDTTRRLGYSAICLTCDGTIDPDERVYREHGVGVWHADCDPPRNLRLYQRERDRGSRRRRRQYDDFDEEG